MVSKKQLTQVVLNVVPRIELRNIGSQVLRFKHSDIIKLFKIVNLLNFIYSVIISYKGLDYLLEKLEKNFYLLYNKLQKTDFRLYRFYLQNNSVYTSIDSKIFLTKFDKFIEEIQNNPSLKDQIRNKARKKIDVTSLAKISGLKHTVPEINFL